MVPPTVPKATAEATGSAQGCAMVPPTVLLATVEAAEAATEAKRAASVAVCSKELRRKTRTIEVRVEAETGETGETEETEETEAAGVAGAAAEAARTTTRLPTRRRSSTPKATTSRT